MPFFKRKNDERLTINDKQVPPTSFPKDSLLPTEKIINLAKKAGVNFGPGNANERIRYFVKLGLLPHAVRKVPTQIENLKLKIKNSGATAPVGHLPYWTVERLIEINRLNNNGLTFPQIAKKIASANLNNHGPIARTSDQLTSHTDHTDSLTHRLTDPLISPLIVKVVPLTDVNSHEMNQKFKDQQKKLESLIDNKFKEQGQVPSFHNPQLPYPSHTSRLTKNAILLVLVFSLASGTIFIGLKGYQRFSGANSKATKQIAQDFQASGQVLAASSANNKLYIDADSEFSGTTLFKENITAPNVVYSVRAGTGIAVSAGQNPTVSIDSAAIVPSINSASGPITLKGSGSTSITNTGGTITISSSSSTSGITSEADTLSSVTGRGATTSTASSFTGGATIGTSLTLSAFSSSGGVLYTNGSGVTAQVTAGTSSQCLLGGTTPSFGSCGSGGMTSFTLSGDSGTDQTISDTNTLEIAGGTNGIDTVGTATDTITLNLDYTEIGNATFGTGSGIVWTFDVGVTDPTLTFASGTLAVSGTFSATNFSGTSSGTNTGDQTITLTGDVTGSGTGSFATTIAANSVALGTDTTNDYVGTITGSTTITSSGATSGEGIAHTLSVTTDSIGDTQLTFNTGQHLATSSSVTFANVTLATGGALRTGTTDTNTALLQAYDVDGTAYTTFGTLTAGNTPTFDLATGVTIGTAYIYRVGGTDVSVADGGTGLSTFGGTNTLLYTSTANNLTSLTNGTTGQCLTATTSSAPSWGSCAGTGVIGGSGTAGQIAFFNGTSTITSESSGFGWDTTNKLFTLTSTTATGSAEAIVANSLSSGNALSISSTSTAATTNYLINLSSSGASNSANRYGLYANMTGTGTTSTNYAAYLTASGATTNYGIFSTSASASNYFDATANTAAVTASNNRLYGGTVNIVNSTSTTGTAAAVISSYNNYTGGAEMATYGLYNNFYSDTGQTTFPYEHYGIYSLMSKSGVDAANAAKNLYGVFSSTSNTSTIVATSAKTTFAVYGTATNTGSWGAGNVTTYGVYAAATGDSSAASTTYGIHATATGADNNYGLSIAAISSASATANIGINVAAISGSSGTNYALVTAGGNISTTLATSTTQQFLINSTTSTATAAGVLDINVTTATGDNRAVDLSYTSSTTTTSANNYGIYANTTRTGDGTNNLYGGYLNFTDAVSPAGVGTSSDFGLAINTTGTTSTNAATATRNVYGLYNSTSSLFTEQQGTTNTYGIFNSSRADFVGTTTLFGIRNTIVENADTTYSLYTATAGVAGGTTSYGIYASGVGGATTNVQIQTGAITTPGTSLNIDLDLGAISGTANGSSNYGSRIGDISSAGTTTKNYGISLGTLTGGTTSNYQISTGLLTSATTTTNAQINLGGVVTTGGTTNYGINVGALSGTGTTNFGIAVQAMTSTGTSDYGLHIGGLSGISTNNYGINIGALSAATAINYGINIAAITPAGTTTAASISTAGIAAGAGTATFGINLGTNASTATNNYGINIGALSGVGTNNYGIYIGSVTGGATTNYALYAAAGNVNIQGLNASQIVLTNSTKNLVSATATAANTCSDCLIQAPTTTARNTVTSPYGIIPLTLATTTSGTTSQNSDNLINLTASAGAGGSNGVAGGIGSGLNWTLGNGGAGSNSTIGFTSSLGGAGGGFSATAGAGGAASGTGVNTAGVGGSFTFTAGAGGTSTSGTNFNGAGGSITLAAGNGTAEPGSVNIGAGTLPNVIHIGDGTVSTTNNPIQTLNPPNLTESVTGAVVYLGFSFSPKVQGKITQIGMKCSGTSVYTLKLYNKDTSVELASVSSTANNGSWNYVAITPIVVYPTVTYQVQSNNSSFNFCQATNQSITFPKTSANVNVKAWYQDTSTPANAAGSEFDGGVDITFVATSAETRLANTKWTISDAGSLIIDASTTANINTDGVINIDASTATGNFSTLNISTVNTGTTGTNIKGYGIYNTWTNTQAVTSGNSTATYGIYNLVSKTGADAATTSAVYGMFSQATYTGSTGGTKQVAAGYFNAVTDANAANNLATGVLSTSTSASKTANYGLQSHASSSQGTNAGLWSIVNDTTTNASTNYGVLTSMAMSGNAAKTIIGTYNNLSSSSTTADKLYGIYAATSATGDVARAANYGGVLYGASSATATSDVVYGLYAASLSGAAANAATQNSYGIYSISANGAASATATAVNAYGGIFSAVGISANVTTGNAYGIYASASGGDNNYPFYMGTAPRSSGTAALCWDNLTDSPIDDCSGAPVQDYAEIYPTASDVDYGDVLTLGTQDVETFYKRTDTDGNVQGPESKYIKKLVKSTTPYDSKVIGIASQNWADFTSTGHGSVKVEDHPLPMALNGRLPVKVTDENGPIAAGDLLTTSSTPGHAMKADPTKGSTFGKALTSFTEPGNGEIMVFVESNTRYNLASALQNTSLEALSFSTSSNNTIIDALGNTTTAGDVVAGGSLSAANGAFTVDAFGNLSANSLTSNSLNITGDANISGTLTVNNKLETRNISAPENTDLNISLSGAATSTVIRFTDAMNNELFTINQSGNATFSGTIYADAFVTHSTADLAEAFPTSDDTISAGDLVAVDPNKKESIELSNQPYQPTLLGIISTEPGFTLSAGKGQALSAEVNPKDLALAQPVALAGRVPTKVNLENGPIKAGDPITSSSTPGVGMRATQAGRVIGIALENYNSTSCVTAGKARQPSGIATDSSNPRNDNCVASTIVVFVNPSWYTGTSLAANGSITSHSQESVSQSPDSSLSTMTLTTHTNPDGTLSAPDEQLTMNDEHIKDLINRQVDAKIDSLIASGKLQPTSYQSSSSQNQINAPVPTTAVLGESTASASINYKPSTMNQSEASTTAAIQQGAQIASETQATLDKLSELLSTKDLSLNTLTLTGASNLAQTQVAGTFSQDGTFVIDYGKQINVLGNTLYLQNDAFAGDQSCHSGLSRIDSGVANAPQNDRCGILVDIGAGAVTIDRQGNIRTQGSLTSSKLTTKELVVDTTDANAKSAGSATLATGKNQVTIFTTLVKPNAKILITPTTPTGGKQLYVATKSEFEGFTVALDGTYAANRIEFDWLIVNTSLQSKL